MLKQNYQHMHSILDFIYLVEVLCTASISGKFDIEAVSLEEFSDLDRLVRLAEKTFSRKESKVHATFSFLRLLQRVLAQIRKDTQMEMNQL